MSCAECASTLCCSINQLAAERSEMLAPLDLRAMHATVFAGQDTRFAPQQRARHDFGVKLIRALSCQLHVHAAITQHAMILWTVAVAKSGGHMLMSMCVACLMLANKIQDNSTTFSLLRFARACGSLPHCRGHVVRDLDAALQTGGDLMSAAAVHLKNQLKNMDALRDADAQLLMQVGNITVGDLRCAETTLLFHVLYDRLNFYLFYAIDYASAGLAHLPLAAQTESIEQMCLL